MPDASGRTSAPRGALPVLRPEQLLAGPRGRRFLLECALAADETAGLAQGAGTVGEAAEGSLGAFVWRAAEELLPSRAYVGWSERTVGCAKDSPGGAEPDVTPEDVALRIDAVDMSDPAPELLLRGLTEATHWACYWGEQNGSDLLADTTPVRQSLRRVAEAVCDSTHVDSWASPCERSGQWVVQWEGTELLRPLSRSGEGLRLLRAEMLAAEAAAGSSAHSGPVPDFSGEWWSAPLEVAPVSTRALAGGAPLKLWCVEDGAGWDRASAHRLAVPAEARIYEIDSAAAWAELCQRFPLEVTARVRPDWFHTTGRDGRWVIPDWVAVAQQYDAVHLQVWAYLAVAGIAIPVGADTATVIAGWNPDETYWFTENVRYAGPPVPWVDRNVGGFPQWQATGGEQR